MVITANRDTGQAFLLGLFTHLQDCDQLHLFNGAALNIPQTDLRSPALVFFLVLVILVVVSGFLLRVNF